MGGNRQPFLAPPLPGSLCRQAARLQELGGCRVGGVSLPGWASSSAVKRGGCPKRRALRGGPVRGTSSGAGPGRGCRRRKRRASSSRSRSEARVQAGGAASAGLAGAAGRQSLGGRVEGRRSRPGIGGRAGSPPRGRWSGLSSRLRAALGRMRPGVPGWVGQRRLQR